MRKISLAAMAVVVWAAGCASKLDDDVLAIETARSQTLKHMIDWQRTYITELQVRVKQNINFRRNEILRELRDANIVPRIVNVDGTPRIYSETRPAGGGAPVRVGLSVKDFDDYIAVLLTKLQEVNDAEREWDKIHEKAFALFDEAEKDSTMNLRTIQDITAAKKSAQAVAERAAAFAGGVTAAIIPMALAN